MSLAAVEHEWVSQSPEETFQRGELVGRMAPGGLLIGVVGPLGAGKTLLVKGIAKGNELADDSLVTSPTFTLVQEYPGRLHLYHLDVYRLRRPIELLALGFDEMMRSDSLVLVEWADKMRDALPAEMLWIELVVTGPTSRSIAIRGVGKPARSCLERLVQAGG